MFALFLSLLADRTKLLPTTMQWCFRYSKEQVDPSAFEMPEVKDIGGKKRAYVIQQEQSDRKQPSKVAYLIIVYSSFINYLISRMLLFDGRELVFFSLLAY